jgi:hypothetical protein
VCILFSAIFPPTRFHGSSAGYFIACRIASSSAFVIRDLPFSFRQTVE